MLTFETLVMEAKNRAMPATKMRGALREYLQVLILKEIYLAGSGKKLYFTGGTYLRLVQNSKRFSEDLDFNTEKLEESEFEALVNKINIEIKRRGMDSHVRFKHWGNIYAAQMVFPSIEHRYNITSGYSKKEGIIIKIETNCLERRIKKETELVSGFGEIFPCICTDKGILFADKIDALGKKLKGRHIYDIIFMLSKNYPVDMKTMSSLGINGEPLDVIQEKINSISKLELKKQAEGLRPFLFEESEAQLIVNAHHTIPALIKKYKQ